MEGNPSAGEKLGKVKYHLYSRSAGDLGSFDTLEEANQAAANHLHNNHRALIEAKKEGADVEISEVTHFGIPEALQFQPTEKRKIEPGKLVTNLNI